MKAYAVSRYGKNERLQLTEQKVPEVGENDVLVEIRAASLNLLDAKIRDGEFKLILPYKMPLILGHDVAGVVTKIGSKVSRFKAGDEVYSRPSDFKIGTFAECIAIDEADVALKPKNLTMEEAASIPLVGLTAWQAIVEEAKLKAGQKVFIQAGSGGVGTIAIQLATHMGATVATTASEKSFAMLKSLGADVLIDYKKEDFEQILKGYDLVINSQDSKTLGKSLNVLRPGGKVISISGPPTRKFAVDMNLPWFLKLAMGFLSRGVLKTAKKLGVDYSFLFMKANGTQLGELTKLIEAGAILPVMDRIYPLAEINEALSYVESGRAKGKVVVKMRNGQ